MKRLLALLTLVLALGTPSAAQAQTTLLNVSYDPTRELYRAFNDAFAKYWATKSGGGKITFRQSHAGSGAQARSVIDGLEADVVTLALAYDVEAISKAGLITPGWIKFLPNNSAPYTSTIVFLVRKGNPKGIKDWSDLVKPGVQVITPEPEDVGRRALELSGGLGVRATAEGRQRRKGERIRRRALQERAGARLRGPRVDDDVHRARHRRRAPGMGERGVPRPRRSQGQSGHRRAVDEHSGRAAGRRRRQGRGQDGHPRGGARPTSSTSTRRRARRSPRRITIVRATRKSPPNTRRTFAKVKLFTIDEAFGGWEAAQKTHFADGGTFDQIYRPGAESRLDVTRQKTSVTVLPGFRLTLGFTLFYLCLIVLVPLLTLPVRTATWAGARSGRRSATPGSSRRTGSASGRRSRRRR